MRRRAHLLAGALLVVLVAAAAAASAPVATVVGTDGPDVLRGGQGPDRLFGKGGADRLFGLGGGDLLVGGPGKDVLEGGAGNDRLVARDGERDTARCGPGSDVAIVDPKDRVSTDCETVLRPPSQTRTFVIAGAGDIAGGGDGDDETARLLDRIRPDLVFTTGDNAYPDGTSEDFRRYYDPTWGRFKQSTRPTPGNHDYHSPGASAYFAYFGDRAPGPYYSFDLGSWHLVALNSEVSLKPGSPQHEWLVRDLEVSDAPCTLAYWHRPRFSAGKYGDSKKPLPFWELLYAEGAEIVLNGHDHNYQRFRPLDPDGRIDTTRGIRQIVVGTGGAGLYGLRKDARREAAQGDENGVLVLTLRPSGYDWRFIPVSGSYSDSGSASCR